MFFQHHPDGWIYLGSSRFTCTVAEFMVQRPRYSMPAGFVGRIYHQGKLHALFDAEGNQRGGEFPWPAGDEYLANAAAIQAAIEASRPTQPPSPPPRQPRELAALRADIAALSAADRQTLMVAAVARLLQQEPRLARDLGIGIDGDEPAP